MALGFIDTETTGLHPYLHEVWEVALIEDHAEDGWDEYRWFLPCVMDTADPVALKIGGYHKRHPHGYDFTKPVDENFACESIVTPHDEFARNFAERTRGMHLVCAMPSFDIPRLDNLLREQRLLPEWHYHVTDIESMIRGKYQVDYPWTSKDLLAACNIGMPEEDKHTALGDARWVRDAYLHCMSPMRWSA